MIPSKNTQTIRIQKIYPQGFTLVELIVVITILAVLGTIAFLSIQGYAASARDSDRIANIANLHKGLSVFQVKSGYYPQPEGSLTLIASGSIIGNQGFAKDRTVMFASLSPGGSQDPSDSSMYTTYLVNTLGTRMQLTTFLEDGSKVTAANLPLGIPETYASSTTNYTTRTPWNKGDTIGVFLSTATGNLNQPLQEIVSATFTGIDVVNFTGNLSDGTPVSLKALTSNTESVSGTGGSFMAIESNMNGKMRIVMHSCPTTAGWTDLGKTPTGGSSAVNSTNNGVDFTGASICETNNNAIIPTGSLILTQSGTCQAPNFNDTGWTTPTGIAPSASCNASFNSPCHICKSVSDSPIPLGTIILMQSCPFSWQDTGAYPVGLSPASSCLYGKSCRICQKL